MWLSVVVQQPGWLVQPPQSYEEFDSLIPGHRAILIVVKDKHGRFYVRNVKNRRVAKVPVRVFPQGTPQPALRPLILEHPRHPRPPTDTPVGTDHINHGRSRSRTGKPIGPGNDMRNLVAAPGVPL